MSYSLAKIADELGLSKATVSMVLNGKARQGRISEEVERNVKKFCEKVNYVPNIHAQRINSKHSGTIGLLVNREVQPYSGNPFCDMNTGAILGGIVLAADNLGSKVSVQLYDTDMDESRVFEWLRNREIDGLIYYGLDMPESWKEVFVKEHHCIVGIGTEPCREISSVNIDNFDMSYEITKRLIQSGRKSFMYVSGKDGTFVSDERKRGCLSALNECGIEIPPEYIISADYSEKKAEQLVLKLKPKRDAIVCANDYMATGTIRALQKMGTDVPSQTAVTGGDNINIGHYLSPSLTTYDNMHDLMGEKAVHILNNLINGGKNETAIISSKIITRESAL